MKLLGIDWGKRKIGLALADDETKIASPILTLSFNNLNEVTSKLREIIVKEQIGLIVIGEPISLSGQKPLAKDYQSFVAVIRKLGLPVQCEDERLSTQLAINLKREWRGRRKISDDEIAAATILQSYLDRTK